MPSNHEIPNFVKHAPLPRYDSLQTQLSFGQWLASVSYETRYAEFRARGIEEARCYLGDDADHHHYQLPDPVLDISEILSHQYVTCRMLRARRAGALYRLNCMAHGVCLILSGVLLGVASKIQVMVA